jgi:hypothetical protein
MTTPCPFGYGRFSNEELQDQLSITDQQHVYTKLADRVDPGHPPIRHFADEGSRHRVPSVVPENVDAYV